MEVVCRSQDWDHEVFLEVGDGDPDEDCGHPKEFRMAEGTLSKERAVALNVKSEDKYGEDVL